MPTVIYSDRFTSNISGWITSSFNVAWYASDGSSYGGASDPGCVGVTGTAGGSPPYTAQSFMQKDIGTWEDLGVPAGATVSSVTGKLIWKFLSEDGPMSLNVNLYLDLSNGSSTTSTVINHTNADSDPANTWVELSTSKVINAPYSASDTNVVVTIQGIGTGGPGRGTEWNGRWDYVVLEITYTSPNITVTLPVVTSFALTSPGGGWGGLYPTGPVPFDAITLPAEFGLELSGLGLYSASTTAWLIYTNGVNTPGGAEFSAEAWGSPTVFEFVNALSGYAYELDLPNADLDGTASGRFLVVRARRIGGQTNTGGNTPLGIELRYDVIQ